MDSTHRSIESVHYNRWDVEFSLSNLLKLLDSNRQPVYYYNEHGQVEIVVITLKEFFKLTFLSFGIPNANRWDVEFSLSNLLKLLDSNRQPVYYYNEHGQVEIVVITLKEFFKLTFLSFGIPNANRWDVEFSLSNLLKLLDSNRQPVCYYNEHGQVEIVVITLKEFFKLTFLCFGIPNANRWDVEFSLSNLLKLLDSNRQPVYYYIEHGQVEIVVITLKEFFKLTFLSFGIPNANRWDVEFSLSNLLKLLDSNRQPVYYYNEHGQVEIVVITLKEFFKLTFLSFGITNANRWDVEFSLSNLLKLLDSNRQPVYYYNEHGQVEIVVITLKEFFKLTFLSFGIPNANRWDVFPEFSRVK